MASGKEDEYDYLFKGQWRRKLHNTRRQTDTHPAAHKYSVLHYIAPLHVLSAGVLQIDLPVYILFE